MTLSVAPDCKDSDILWRVDGEPWTADGKPSKVRVVPYLDAATVARLLDEWVGPTNWRDSYETIEVAGERVMQATVEVRDAETGEWVPKHDIGTDTQFEAAKGIMSDAFKRAGCLKWGAGRNVYGLGKGGWWVRCQVRSKNGKMVATLTDESYQDIAAKLREVSGAR